MAYRTMRPWTEPRPYRRSELRGMQTNTALQAGEKRYYREYAVVLRVTANSRYFARTRAIALNSASNVTGLVRCASKPARVASSISDAVPKPLSAIAFVD